MWWGGNIAKWGQYKLISLEDEGTAILWNVRNYLPPRRLCCSASLLLGPRIPHHFRLFAASSWNWDLQIGQRCKLCNCLHPVDLCSVGCDAVSLDEWFFSCWLRDLEYEGITVLWNILNYLSDNTASYPKRLRSSETPLWELYISHLYTLFCSLTP